MKTRKKEKYVAIIQAEKRRQEVVRCDYVNIQQI